MSQRKGLTLRQKAFVAEYLADYNATRAAHRAGAPTPARPEN